MARWRKEAFERLPEFRKLLQEEKSPYSFLTMLVGELRQAHVRNDLDRIRRIYSYAKMCIDAPRGKDASDDLLTIAAVSFFEHLPQHVEIRRNMGRWFARRDIEGMKDVLLYHGTEEQFNEIVASCDVEIFKKKQK